MIAVETGVLLKKWADRKLTSCLPMILLMVGSTKTRRVKYKVT